MKYFGLLMAFAISIGFSGCGEEEEPSLASAIPLSAKYIDGSNGAIQDINISTGFSKNKIIVGPTYELWNTEGAKGDGESIESLDRGRTIFEWECAVTEAESQSKNIPECEKLRTIYYSQDRVVYTQEGTKEYATVFYSLYPEGYSHLLIRPSYRLEKGREQLYAVSIFVQGTAEDGSTKAVRLRRVDMGGGVIASLSYEPSGYR